MNRTMYEDLDRLGRIHVSTPKARRDVEELLAWLKEIERYNDVLRSQDADPIDLTDRIQRVIDYGRERERIDQMQAQREDQTGQPLSVAENEEIEAACQRSFEQLSKDLMYASAGFKGGTREVFSFVDQYDALIDDIAEGIGTSDTMRNLQEKMAKLSYRERRDLIDDLYASDRISSVQHEALTERMLSSSFDNDNDPEPKPSLEALKDQTLSVPALAPLADFIDQLTSAASTEEATTDSVEAEGDDAEEDLGAEKSSEETDGFAVGEYACDDGCIDDVDPDYEPGDYDSGFNGSDYEEEDYA